VHNKLRAEQWLDARVHQVTSRSTGEPPASRLAVERVFLSPPPRVRFDTDYVETRRAHNIVPFISVDGGRGDVRGRGSRSTQRNGVAGAGW
jgi:hypothetical protein